MSSSRTLVVQGLTLLALIQVLGLEDDGLAEKEEAKARIHVAEVVLGGLEELVEEEIWVGAVTPPSGWVGSDGFRR